MDPTDDQGGAVAFDREGTKGRVPGYTQSAGLVPRPPWSRIRSFPDGAIGSVPGIVVGLAGGRGEWRARDAGRTAAESCGWCRTNQAPVVVLTTKGPFSTASAVEFDVSGTTDDLDSGGSLEFRWDWTDDGNFDTEFSP